MRWLWLGLSLAACGTATEGVSTSTSPILADEAEADAGSMDPLPSVDESPLAIPGVARRVTYSPDAPFTALMFAATEGQDLGFLVEQPHRRSEARGLDHGQSVRLDRVQEHGVR